MHQALTRKPLSIAVAACALLAATLGAQAAPGQRTDPHAKPLLAPAKACDGKCLADWFDAQRQLTDGSVAPPRR